MVAAAAIIAATPWMIHVLNTVSTDDAYVNGHVTNGIALSRNPAP